MKLLSTLLLLFLLQACSRRTSLFGTYLNTFTDDIHIGACCKLMEALKLNKDSSFNYYRNDDQGDYTDERFATGKYGVKGDSIYFSQNNDSIAKKYRDRFLKYNGFKFKILRNGIESLEPVGVVAGGRSEKIRYHKFRFEDLDSLKFSYYMSHNPSGHEDVLIKKNRHLQYTWSLYDRHTEKTDEGTIEFGLTGKKYNLFIRTLSADPLYEFEPGRGEDDSTLTLWAKGDSFKVYGFYISQKLRLFLLTQLARSDFR